MRLALRRWIFARINDAIWNFADAIDAFRRRDTKPVWDPIRAFESSTLAFDARHMNGRLVGGAVVGGPVRSTAVTHRHPRNATLFSVLSCAICPQRGDINCRLVRQFSGAGGYLLRSAMLKG